MVYVDLFSSDEVFALNSEVLFALKRMVIGLISFNGQEI